MTSIFVDKSNKKIRNCTVKLNRIDPNTLSDDPEKMRKTRSMRNQTEKPAQVEKPVQPKPGKRSIRFKSTPAESTKSIDDEALVSNNKKRRHVLNAVTTESGTKPSKKQKIENDDVTQIVAMNCKLANEIIGLKNVVLEKNDCIIKLQDKCHQKTVECISLESKLDEAQKLLEELHDAYQGLKAEQFCSDLIKFDDNDEAGMYRSYFLFFKFQSASIIMV